MESHVSFLAQKSIKILCLILFLPIIIFEAHAQVGNSDSDAFQKTNFYSDFGGHITFQASFNIESQLYAGDKLTWYGRGGFGFAGIINDMGGPGGLGALTMLTGKDVHHFELNGGAFAGYDIIQKEIFILPLLDVGYRYQRPSGGFIFRTKLGLLGAGLSLGYAF